MFFFLFAYFFLCSFDDSSSVSSGVSDTFPELSTDENLTGSSVSSENTNVYGSLRRNHKSSRQANTAANTDKARKVTRTFSTKI